MARVFGYIAYLKLLEVDGELEEGVGKARERLNSVVDSGEEESELAVRHPLHVSVNQNSGVLGHSDPEARVEVS